MVYKMNTKQIALFMLALLVFACSKENGEEEVEEEIVIEDELTDPFYASLDEDSTLDDYWEIFRQDAIRSGRPDPGFERQVVIFYGTEPDFASGVTADHAGRAYDICNDNNIRFELIKSFWEDYSIPRRLFTFYHEAGHARYKYRHPCESGETCNYQFDHLPIMWRSVAGSDYKFSDFIRDKEDFFARRWDGIRYFNCN